VPANVKQARLNVSKVFGKTLADKASESFCLVFGKSEATQAGIESVLATRARFESIDANFDSLPIVLEFKPLPLVMNEINKAVESVRKSTAWSNIRNELNKVEMASVTRGVATEVMESGRTEPEILPLSGARLLRHVKVLSIRDNFLKISGPITDEIERGSRPFLRAGPETVRVPQRPSSITQLCWLNQTVRSFVHPRSLTEVVSDPSISKVDLARRLEAEINVTGGTVGTVAFRKKFNLTGKGVIVAVIDSEVAMNHPALKGRVVHKQNMTAESWGNPGSHGTAVAGIIASNIERFLGMAPRVTIYNYKVLAANPLLNSDDFDGALAIQQAVEDGAHIANCSWGAGPAGDGSSREAKACDAAWDLGLLIVKSAGNNGPSAKSLTTPADANGVIVVGATDNQGKKVQDYSSRGPSKNKPRPHLLAPGGIDGGIGITSCLIGGGFGDCGAGTSFAAPHVSGMLALLIERNQNLVPDQLREILLKACKRIKGVSADTQGRGLMSLSRVP
jgi:serine protease AprX